MAIYTFVPADFKTDFPEYSTVTDTRLNLFFKFAEKIVNNSDASVVPYDPDATPPITERKELLDLLVAHQCELLAKGAGAVGRTSSGSEGSVSFSLEMKSPETAAWYMQTQWGVMYWEMTTKYRTMRMFNGSNNPRRYF